MLENVVVPIDFGIGVDTKTDSKNVVAGKLLRLENAVFTNNKRLKKRNGYDVIGGIDGAVMTASLYDELLVADNELLKSYSPTLDVWNDKGNFISLETNKTTVDQLHQSSGYIDSVNLNGLTYYTYCTLTDPVLNLYYEVWLAVIDDATGDFVYGPEIIFATPFGVLQYNPVKMTLLGGVVPAAFMLTEANTIVCQTISIVAGVITPSAPITVSTGTVDNLINNWDIDNTVDGGVLVYQTTDAVNQIRVTTIDTAAAIVNTVTFVEPRTAVFIRRNRLSEQLFVYIYNSGTGDLSYTVLNDDLTTALAVTLGDTFTSYMVNLISHDTSSTEQRVFLCLNIVNTVGGVSTAIDSSYYKTFDTAGVVTLNSDFAHGVCPVSHPIQKDGNFYAVFVSRGPYRTSGAAPMKPLQPTFFLIRLNKADEVSQYVVSRFAVGVAYTRAMFGINYRINLTTIIENQKFLFSCGAVFQDYRDDYYFGGSFGTQAPGLAGSFGYLFDFDSQNINQNSKSGESILFGGGLIQSYDGQSVNEHNFHHYPEIFVLTALNGAGTMVPGTYSYIAIYQWTDKNGNLQYSAASPAVSITLVGGEDAVNVRYTTNYVSQKESVSINIYRTQDNGSIYYLVTNPAIPQTAEPNFLGSWGSFNDTIPDADLLGNPNPYTYPGSQVLENTATPPATLILAHNNRSWFVNDENKNEIWYSKSYSQDTAISYSGFLTQLLDPKLGNITGLAEMDEKIIYFKKTGLFAQAGDGASDTGTGSSLSFPQMVPSDVGCSESKSIVLTPNGIFFKSLNGIYLLNRSLSVTYVGAEVEQYNSQSITSAKLINGVTEIRFLTNSGLTLIYDYLFNQWGTFTNHEGVSATIWLGDYVYIRSNGEVYQENANIFEDAGTAYSLLIQTSWLHLGSVQGFQRVKRLIMLGDFESGVTAGHGLDISAAYDFVNTFGAAINYTFSGGPVYQYRERLPRQKCDSISLLIEEVTADNSTDYIDLTNISFEAAVKRGVNKLSNAQSVG